MTQSHTHKEDEALQVVEPSIRVVEKATCFSVHRGCEVLGNFAGPDCEEHARMFADALLASAAGEPQGVTETDVGLACDQIFVQIADPLQRAGVRAALESFAASRPVAVGVKFDERDLLGFAEEAGLFPNTINRWYPALKRYTDAVLAASTTKAGGAS
jgi:hypothetical protein